MLKDQVKQTENENIRHRAPEKGMLADQFQVLPNLMHTGVSIST
jgi:hypothetical protein